MANQQDIVMNLIAKLDKGNIESEAAQMAQGVSSAMEQAFEALGQKIANSIMRGGVAGIQAVQNAAQNVSGTPLPPGTAPAAPMAPPMPTPQAAPQFQQQQQQAPLAQMPAMPAPQLQVPTQMQQALQSTAGIGGVTTIPPELVTRAREAGIQLAQQIQTPGIDTEQAKHAQEILQKIAPPPVETPPMAQMAPEEAPPLAELKAAQASLETTPPPQIPQAGVETAAPAPTTQDDPLAHPDIKPIAKDHPDYISQGDYASRIDQIDRDKKRLQSLPDTPETQDAYTRLVQEDDELTNRRIASSKGEKNIDLPSDTGQAPPTAQMTHAGEPSVDALKELQTPPEATQRQNAPESVPADLKAAATIEATKIAPVQAQISRQDIQFLQQFGKSLEGTPHDEIGKQIQAVSRGVVDQQVGQRGQTFSQLEKDQASASEDAASQHDREILSRIAEEEKQKKAIEKQSKSEQAKAEKVLQKQTEEQESFLDLGDTDFEKEQDVRFAEMAKRIESEEKNKQKQQAPEAAKLEQFPGGFPQTTAFSQVRENYPVFKEAQIVNQLRENNIPMPNAPEQQERFKEAGTSIDQALRANSDSARTLSEKISALERALEENNKGLDKLTGVERQTVEEKIADIGKERQQAVRDLDATSKATDALAIQKQAITQAAQPQTAGMDLGRAAGPLGVIAAGLQLAGTLPGTLRRSEAANAEVGNIESRSLLRGDPERLLATERLGGTEGIRGRARVEEGLGVAGNLGAAAASALAAPVTGGLSLAGTAYFGMRAIQGMAGFGQNVQQNVEGQLSTEQTKNFELFEASRAGRNAAVGSFRAGQTMGAPELGGFLMGQGADTEALRARLRAEEHRTEVEVKASTRPVNMATMDMPDEMPTSRPLTQAEESVRQQNIKGLQGEIGQAEQVGRTREGQTLMEAGITRGHLSVEQVQQTLGTLAQGMGAGAFMNQTTGKMGQPELERQPDAVASLLRSQGLGLTQAPQIATALQQGGMDRGQAMEATAKMFEDAISAGLDKAKVGQAMMTMASRAEAAGFRGADVAVRETQQALGMAQQVFGKGVGIEGPEMAFTQRTMGGMNDMTRGRGGIGMMGGIRGVQAFEQESGMKLSAVEEVALQRFAPDAKGMQQLMQQKTGKDVSLEDAEKASARLQQLEREQMLKVQQRALGKEGGTLAMAEQLGVTSLSGFLGTQQIAQNVRKGKVGGPFTGEGPDQGTVSFQTEYERDALGNIKKDEAGNFKTIEMPQFGMEKQKKFTERGTGQFVTEGEASFDENTGQFVPAKQREVTEGEKGTMQAPGQKPADILAGVDAKNVATGLTNLGSQLPALNDALKQLIDRAQKVLADAPMGESGKGLSSGTGVGAQMGAAKAAEMISSLEGGRSSSSMFSSKPISSYMNGGASQ